MQSSTVRKRILIGLITFVCLLNLSTQADSFIGKEVAKEKKFVLEWLSQPQFVERFGKISDMNTQITAP